MFIRIGGFAGGGVGGDGMWTVGGGSVGRRTGEVEIVVKGKGVHGGTGSGGGGGSCSLPRSHNEATLFRTYRVSLSVSSGVRGLCAARRLQEAQHPPRRWYERHMTLPFASSGGVVVPMISFIVLPGGINAWRAGSGLAMRSNSGRGLGCVEVAGCGSWVCCCVKSDMMVRVTEGESCVPWVVTVVAVDKG